jgi:hypothetical protein
VICPGCGYETVPDDSVSGFGPSCDGKHYIADYEAQESDAIEARKTAWRKRAAPSTSREAARARQRRHRLKEALTPTEPPPANADPWEIAKEAVGALNKVRAGVAHNPILTEQVDLAAERVRWLAIGPQD